MCDSIPSLQEMTSLSTTVAQIFPSSWLENATQINLLPSFKSCHHHVEQNFDPFTDVLGLFCFDSVASSFFPPLVWWCPVLKQQERLDIEEKYTSLQEEAQGKTKKLKKVWTMLMAAKSEVSTTMTMTFRKVNTRLCRSSSFLHNCCVLM